MYEIYFRDKDYEVHRHCDESWQGKVSSYPQLGHKVFLKLAPGRYVKYKVVDIEWNDSTTILIDLEKEE